MERREEGIGAQDCARRMISESVGGGVVGAVALMVAVGWRKKGSGVWGLGKSWEVFRAGIWCF